MRLIQATIPPDGQAEVREFLNERGIDYFATHETGTDDYAEVLYISIPEQEVESALQGLYAAGLNTNDHVVLIDTEVDIFGRTEPETAETAGYARIASAELEGKTEDLLPDPRTFVTMMSLSTIVATTGILLDSSAVVVGSMVLAPLFGPAVSASVGTVVDESDLFWQGIKFQILGVGLAVVGASVFAWLLKTTYLLPSGFALTAAPQVIARLSPDLLSLVVAFAAGVAGVISIATASGRTLVGVMMAAALLPPTAVVGIGIAWNEPTVAIQSGILLAVNLLAINFAGLTTLWYLGYRPQSWVQIPQTRRALIMRASVLLIAILLTSGYLFNVTYAGAQRTQLENAIEEDVSQLIGTEAYENVSLVDVQVVQDQTSLTSEPEKVTITIARPPGESHPKLHREIDASVEEQVGHEIPVDVRVTLIYSQ